MGQEKKMSPDPPPEFELVDTPRALAAFAQMARQAAMVAVDLEADSMFHYQEKVCLVQMAANGHIVVIDPLKVPDLSALKPIFEDTRILKVFHGADYDVRSLYRDFDIAINNLFDTQLASMYLGQAETSLEAVVTQRFGVELNKKYQKKDWSKRPLPKEMIFYAAADVRYLIPLARTLITELNAKNRLTWVEQACLSLSRVRPPENDNSPFFLRFRGAGRLTPKQLAVLEGLLQVRDTLAKQKDRPWFKIIGNAMLLKLAVIQPTSFKGLKASKVLSTKQLDMYGTLLVSAVKKARRIPENKLPQYPRRKSHRLSPKIPPRVKALRDWRDQVAEKMALDPALLLNKALIRDLAVAKPGSAEDLAKIATLQPWQVETFGGKIVAILKNIP